MSVQLLHHLLSLPHAPVQLGRVLRWGQLAVIRLQDCSHAITLLSGRTEITFRVIQPLSPLRAEGSQNSNLPIVFPRCSFMWQRNPDGHKFVVFTWALSHGCEHTVLTKQIVLTREIRSWTVLCTRKHTSLAGKQRAYTPTSTHQLKTEPAFFLETLF